MRKHHNYSIRNYAKAGDTLENMIYGTGINSSFQRTTPSIDKVLRKIGKTLDRRFIKLNKESLSPACLEEENYTRNREVEILYNQLTKNK